MREIIRRPPAEKRKIHSKNEFELCYIRHQYLRRVKYNPTAEEMAPYRSIIRYLTQRTFYTYPGLFHTVGMAYDDVHAIGMVNLVNFIGLFEFDYKRNRDKYDKFRDTFRKKEGKRPSKHDILNKNKANLTIFMKQRMEDLVRICKQKARNIKGLRVDSYLPFYGPTPPPEELFRLLDDHDAYGYKKLDNVQFKAIRKRCKAKDGEPFRFGPMWYVSVPLEHRNLSALDLAGGGWDPYENEHNLDPEKILFRKEEEIKFDKRVRLYKNYSKERKAKVILNFIKKCSNNPKFEEEIGIARRVLRKMGIRDVGK